MKSIAWARGIYLLGVALVVLLYLPQSWFPLMAGKITAVALCLLIAGLLYCWSVWRGTAEPMPGVALLVALLPLAYLLSFAFSADRAIGVIGTGIETDTLLFMTVAFLAALLGAALFRTATSIRLFIRVLFSALLLAILFQCVVILFGLPGPFVDRSVNLIGKWNDFGISALLLGFLLLIEMQFGHLTMWMRRGAPVLLVVLLILLGVVNFAVAWALLLVVALMLLVIGWVSSRKVAWGALAAGVIAVVFLFFGATLNAQLSKIIPVTSLEIRPSLQSTFDVTSAAHGASIKNAAFGTGPDTFGLSWLMHKPAAVNQSQFWNLDFTVGFSTLSTALSSVGLLGALMWLLPALLVLFGLWRVRGVKEGRMTLWSVAGGALLLWTIIVLYDPSPSLILIAFAFAGVSIGLLWRGAMLVSGRRTTFILACVIAVLFLWSGGASARRFVAEAYVGQGAAALQAGNTDSAQTLAARSVSIEAMPENLRLVTDAGTAKLTALATAADPASQPLFTSLLQQTVDAGQRAVLLDNQDYRSYVSLGQVYDFLAANKVQGAYANAKASYDAAEALSPMSPAIPLTIAKLEATSGTAQGLQDALKQSLTLKPDYTDAILFLAQVDIARNDLTSAISDTQKAVQTAPGVPSIWLELGLLYYAGNDTKDAIPPLEQALKLQPNYANAQYFLGICYAAQGRTQDALTLFEQLAVTNPSSADVQSALANMQAGRMPLDNATTTATTTPSKSTKK
jgi:tetratricopeptide (TPR) repeat protein